MVHENIERMLASIDGMRVEEILGFFTEDIYFQLGNGEPVVGQVALRQGITVFLASIQGLRHKVTGMWMQDKTVTVTSDVTYTRLDGKQVTLPCASIVQYRGELVFDYRIYIDISPVYA